ncbi:DsbA family oxidoreductase [Altererythrobacter arenosus]|uniref:DsbA family oxidoreductase n=1 Tax=Altererythrobacter arenosus TaxID=3032592 RepID=A0ABY8FQN7_9SPHN|nr:DsbA family oxidoreductase [Altererythrobacter sp. CAU 1644]WFL76555.1 DsbA family oxidoreductase [Altererythrobacter sp. CAU 1644]
MTAPHPMTIDIWSDVMCPWCYVGWGNLKQALEQLGDEVEPQIRWHAFELNPDMAPEGEDRTAHIARKYGRTLDESKAVQGRMREAADTAKVSLDYEGAGEDGADAPPAMMWNTRDAHKLLTWALEQAGPQAQTALKLALFKAHFNARRNVSDHEVLLDVAASVGLHREAAKAALVDSDLEARVVAEERAAWDMNISGVPAMVLNGKFMVPGAQPPETYVNVLRRVIEKTAA